MPDYSASFGQRVRELRRKKKLTQSEMAAVLDTKNKSVSDWEHGNSTPNFAKLCDLADYFDVSLDYLVGRSDDPGRR